MLVLFQDIFECRTCGLTGSLCCCTECARVCHKGHDCKLKRTSPTAYCDCWEKCKCKALIQGNQTARYDLLCRLIADTNLVTQHNSRYLDRLCRIEDKSIHYITANLEKGIPRICLVPWNWAEYNQNSVKKLDFSVMVFIKGLLWW